MTPGTEASVVSNHWLTEAPVLSEQFLGAEPFQLFVLDDFLDAAFATSLEEEFPAIEASIATYADKEVGAGEVRPRTTGWVPRNAGVSKRLLARNYNALVTLKNRWLGNGTAKNR